MATRPLPERVVVTGLGVVACCGIGKDAFWTSVRDGISGISHLDLFDVSDLPTKIGGQVRGFDPTDYIEAKQAKHQGRFTQYAIAAAREAFDDSGLESGRIDRGKVGVAFGSSGAGYGNIGDDVNREFTLHGVSAVHPSAITEVPAHAAASHIAIELGLKGPSMSASTGCITSVVTAAQGIQALRAGTAEAMIVGASEASLGPLVFGLLCRLRVMTTRNNDPATAVRPFDRDRDGLALSDGAGAMVLENARHAVERGARIYAEILGYGMASEAYHMVLSPPGCEEMARALRAAVVMARISPDEIDYVSAHGVGNRPYDIADVLGVKSVLGEHAYHVPVNSIKAVTGQSFAASAAMQAIAGCMTMATGTVPPTINHEIPDEQCDLDCVPGVARRAYVSTMALNAHSFGGSHAALILRRFQE